MKKKILIIDDNAEIAELTKKYLERRGYDVKAAGSAVLGLNLLSNDSFDVLISDINMPEINGEEFVKKAKILYPNLVILLITGYVSFDKTQKAQEVGAHECLTKPVELEKLCVSIASGLKAAEEKRKSI